MAIRTALHQWTTRSKDHPSHQTQPQRPNHPIPQTPLFNTDKNSGNNLDVHLDELRLGGNLASPRLRQARTITYTPEALLASHCLHIRQGPALHQSRLHHCLASCDMYTVSLIYLLSRM